MTYVSPYRSFRLESYDYNPASGVATFRYSFDGERSFSEQIHLTPVDDYDADAFDRMMQLAHVLIGISYYKTFLAPEIDVLSFNLDESDAEFFSNVYRDGLSQYIYENSLHPDMIARFRATELVSKNPLQYSGKGTLVLQSGGKDSLLLAQLLAENSQTFSAFYCGSNDKYPEVVDDISADAVHIAVRKLDSDGLKQAQADGGKNGHVPVTFIVLTISLLQAVLQGKSTILMAVGQEGEEPHAMIGDYAIRHQWSKTWQAEKMMSEYITRLLGGGMRVGSPLRGMSELLIAKEFHDHCWTEYSHRFSSCNVANYKQGNDTTQLTWCAKCSKCANSFLLFSPWVSPSEMQRVFGTNLFADPALTEDFKGLLGIDGVFKPFECVGEIDELRAAYHLALRNHPVAKYTLPFEVPPVSFDISRLGAAQPWAAGMIS
jgi:UDP-N-acetyl-alpha-D-muramoyl-L-alanyl-L-glutamate epimerase